MNLSNYKWGVLAAKLLFAFVLSMLPYIVAKVTNPQLAQWFQDNAAEIAAVIVAMVTGVDAQGLHQQNAVVAKVEEKDAELRADTGLPPGHADLPPVPAWAPVRDPVPPHDGGD